MTPRTILLSAAVMASAFPLQPGSRAAAQAADAPAIRAIAVRPFYPDTGALGPDIDGGDGPVVNQTVAGHVVRDYLVVVTLSVAPDRDMSASRLDLAVSESGRAKPWLRARGIAAMGAASPAGEVHLPVLVTLRPCGTVRIDAALRGGGKLSREIDFVCQN